MPDGPVTEFGFDVIGDVHGCSRELLDLLGALGYTDESGAHRHPSRQAIFVGDLIDRGPGQVQVLRTVRAMAEAGSAQVVMGNHEFNAIAYAAPHPARSETYLRPHTEKNTNQHAAFLAQIGAGSADHADVVEWFATLPLWLDLDGLRVVHACWDPDAMRGLGTPHVDEGVMVAATSRDQPAYDWVEHLCKGPEVQLPDGQSFQDKDGQERSRARFRWWDPEADTYAQACEVPSGVTLPDAPLDHQPVGPYHDQVPVIFGHYWRRWPNVELTDTTACVDYSAVKGGPLVAYRWTGETGLRPDHLFPLRP